MSATFTDDWTTIHHGDCLTVMADMEPDSIDAIVTDPPYGLSFMGRDWDYGVPGEPFWREALRVAKPGAHLVAFGGTRTYHRLACAIEDAGWEIRDCLGWLYGSGFPKSMDVSKQIDASGGASIEFANTYKEMVAKSGMTHSDIDRALGIKSSSCYWVRTDHRRSFPASHHWVQLKSLLNIPDSIDAIYTRAEREDRVVSAYGSNDVLSPTKKVENKGTPITESAVKWQGWGTALKPAWEPCILARKPLTSTVAGNVQRWGTGAINIDGCRVDAGEGRPLREVAPLRDDVEYAPHSLAGRVDGSLASSKAVGETTLGRWPANIVHDGSDEVLAVFPNDSHRFFYAAKADKRERDDGLFDFEMVSAAERAHRQPDTAGLVMAGGKANPFAGTSTPAKNTHPTVKPLDLMRWLVRLVTPPDGVVLDPFMGSGTTLKAARAEGHQSIGIDLEREHCEIAWGRLSQGVLL